MIAWALFILQLIGWPLLIVGLWRMAHRSTWHDRPIGLPPSFTGPRAPDRREKAFLAAIWAAEELER